jgi:hypothetical protein
VRNTGKILGTFNATFLALTPKVDKPTSFDEFQSMSIVANSLAVRMKKIFS